MSPKFRQTFYYVSTIITSVIGIALLYGGLSAGTANSITEVLAGLGGLLGAAGPAIAAKKVSEQNRDGVFNQSPTDQILAGAKKLETSIDTHRDQLLEAKAVLSGVLSRLPVLGDDLEEALRRIKF